MARSAVKTGIGLPFTHLTSINSTNIYAMEQLQANLAEHGAAFFADEQTNGKAQMGKHWHSLPGQNILLSVIMNTKALSLSKPFPLSAAIALACIDVLQQYIQEDLSIKWPNDIYWRDRKTGGILIENLITGNKWPWSIVGMGININQTVFEGMEQKAVSLKQITGKTYSAVAIAKELCTFLTARLTQLELVGSNAIMDDYQQLLYKRNQSARLKKGNIIGTYTIIAVSEDGELVTNSGLEQRFTHGSVEWVIDPRP